MLEQNEPIEKDGEAIAGRVPFTDGPNICGSAS